MTQSHLDEIIMIKRVLLICTGFIFTYIGVVFFVLSQHVSHQTRPIIIDNDQSDQTDDRNTINNLRSISKKKIESCTEDDKFPLASKLEFLTSKSWIQTSKSKICHSSIVPCACAWATTRLCGLKKIHGDRSPCNAVCCCEVLLESSIKQLIQSSQMCTNLVQFKLHSRQLITDRLAESTTIAAGCGCDWVEFSHCDPRLNDGSKCWRACCSLLHQQELLLRVEQTFMISTRQHDIGGDGVKDNTDIRRISFPVTSALPPWKEIINTTKSSPEQFYFQDVDDLLPNHFGSTHTRMPLKRTLCRQGLLPTLCSKTTVLKCISCLLSWYVILSKDGQFSHDVWSTRTNSHSPITLYESLPDSVGIIPPTLDIGIPWACNIHKLKTFLQHLPDDINPALDARLLITNFQNCGTKSNKEDHTKDHNNNNVPNKSEVADIIKKYANKKLRHYRVIDVPGTFQRAHGCNVLHDYARENSILTVLDVDMRVQTLYFRRSMTFASAKSSIYFPIVWSRFSPQGIERISKYRNEDPKIHEVVGSSQGGKWRVWGAGNYAISGIDAKTVRMNDHFKGWGGEDDDFLARSSKILNVIRARDPYIVHNWHTKDCSATKGKRHISCVGSKAEYEGSSLSFLLNRGNDV